MKRKILAALLATFTTLKASERVEFEYEGLNISAPKKYEKEIKEKLLPALELKEFKTAAKGAKIKWEQRSSRAFRIYAQKIFNLILNEKLVSRDELRSLLAQKECKFDSFYRQVASMLDNFKGFSFWSYGEVLRQESAAPYTVDKKTAKVKWNYSYAPGKVATLNIPFLMLNKEDFSDEALKKYKVLQYKLINEAVMHAQSQVSLFFFQYFSELSHLLTEKKSISFENQNVSKNWDEALSFTLAGKVFQGNDYEIVIGMLQKSRTYNDDYELFNADEFIALSKLISFTKDVENTLKLTPEQKTSFSRLKHDLLVNVLYQALSQSKPNELKSLLEKMKRLPQPVTAPMLLSTVKTIYNKDLESELEKVAQEKAKNYRVQYNRKHDIYTEDDPLKLSKYITTPLPDEGVTLHSPELTARQQASVKKIYKDYKKRVDTLISNKSRRFSEEVVQGYIESIKERLTLTPSANALKTTRAFVPVQTENLQKRLYNAEGMIDVYVVFMYETIRRIKAGVKVPGLGYPDEDGLLGIHLTNLTHVNGKETKEELNTFPLMITIKEGSNEAILMPFSPVELIHGDISLFLFLHELAELTICNQIIDITAQTKCRWFHDGLANYVSMKTVPELVAKEYTPETIKKLCKVAQNVKLYDWPALKYAKKFDKENNVTAYYYFSMQVFLAIEKEFGEAFIPKWMMEIRKTPYEETTMKTIDSAFKKLTGKDLPTYANNIVKSFSLKNGEK